MSVRDARGRFVKGNPGGPGRARGERQYLEAMVARVTPAKWQMMVDKMVDMAVAGDTQAFRVLTSYLCGQPVQRLQLSAADASTLALLLGRLDELGLSASDLFVAMMNEVAAQAGGDGQE